MHDVVSKLSALAVRHAAVGKLPIPRLRILTASHKTQPAPAIYEPLLYFVLQGCKRIVLGDRIFDYTPGRLVVASIDLPVLWQVTDASPSAPYLAIALELDRAAIAALLLEMPAMAETESSGLSVGPQSQASMQALLRLVGLLDAPDDIGVLAPLAERELLYRVLQGREGALIREFARVDGRLMHVSRAVAWIRAHPFEPLRVDALAAIAGMSRTSLHRHFKAVTGMSPLAYQKELRLQEARYRLIAEPGDVARIAFAVGYESVSQFSREYARQFGAPPARDSERLRSVVDGARASSPR